MAKVVKVCGRNEVVTMNKMPEMKQAKMQKRQQMREVKSR